MDRRTGQYKILGNKNGLWHHVLCMATNSAGDKLYVNQAVSNKIVAVDLNTANIIPTTLKAVAKTGSNNKPLIKATFVENQQQQRVQKAITLDYECGAKLDLGVALRKLSFAPKIQAAIDGGNLYISVSTDSSNLQIDPKNYIDQPTRQGPYLEQLSYKMTFQGGNWKEHRHGPKNLKANYTVTDMEQMSLGVTIGQTPSANASYTLGTSTTTTFTDFALQDQTYGASIQGAYKLTSVGGNAYTGILPVNKGTISKNPTSLSKGNFPVYFQGIYYQRVNPSTPRVVKVLFQLDTKVAIQEVAANKVKVARDLGSVLDVFGFMAPAGTMEIRNISIMQHHTDFTEFEVAIDVGPLLDAWKGR